MHRRRDSAGVTLLEMLLVVALLAIAAALAGMVLSGGMRGMQLRAASQDIAAQLRYTRARAIASGEPQRFTIEPRAHRWTGAEGRRGEIPAALSVAFTGAREAAGAAAPADAQGAILFFPDGASTGGRIELLSGDAGWRVDVGWLMGDVRLRRVGRS
ncbi:type II secretion system protein XpsH [Pseudoxanthomonas composti]|uniref:Type II secretion system protein H n=1 Tax=Pseudoxanthomonas composti TaxID=2137479 RepID=A0A4Q1JRP4_9GAMM|nr:GspH/FimT family pseudopilin [Pseudoxanthomonas composti]RXR01386.1 type II secretion system protein GspH [Pseudoxanthomonas composti]